MRIRTHHAVLAAGLAAAAFVVPAVAQQDAQDLPATRIVSEARATPNRAGTPAHPQGMKITASARLFTPPDVEAPIVTGVDILTGKGITWTHGKYARCSKGTLDRHGPGGCPRVSIMGSARASGNADTVATHVDLTFVNGGPGITYIYAKLNNPARVRETLVLKSQSLRGGGAWGQRETVSIPRSLQIVGGVPLQLTRIKLTVGGKSYAKEFIANTSCPRGGWKYQVTAHYLYESLGGRTSDDVSTGSIPCRR
jgi:hypothetical protein